MKEAEKNTADQRKARLAEQLRANLKRRKEQSRARKTGDKAQPAEPAAKDDVAG